MIQRRSPRLKGWDYGAPSTYFITVVTDGRRRLFGSINGGGVMIRSALGTIAEAEWWRTAMLTRTAECLGFVLMPNHVHAIVYLNSAETMAGRASPAPTTTLSILVGGYKSAVSRRAGRAIWQRSFYDRIIRSEHELEALWDYIESNPARWAEDHENPASTTESTTTARHPRMGTW